jgi:hypothetical protein
MLHRIRSERGFDRPWFDVQGVVHRAGRQRYVNVRAVIIARYRFGILPVQDVKALDRRWAAHRESNRSDLYGSPSH